MSINRIDFLLLFGRTVWRAFRCRVGAYDRMTCLAARHPTDKGVTFFPFHGYTKHYDEKFERLRELPITLLEIGLARKRDRNNPRVTCPSLELWAEYFPRATLVGFDIDDFSGIRQARTTIYQGDQGRVDNLKKILHSHPTLDVIVDDGSHASYHQQVTLSALWPALSPNGVYIIEDLDSQPTELERNLPKVQKTIDLLRNAEALKVLLGGEVRVEIFDSPLRRTKDTMACLRRVA